MIREQGEVADRGGLVRVLSDGALAGPVADGRLIPVLVIDTAGRPDIRELVRQHKHFSPGDAKHRWATSPEDEDLVVLMLTFDRPSEVDVVLAFSIEDEGILVDAIVRCGMVYLQPGTERSRVSTTVGDPKVLVELPDTGFGPYWDSLFEKRMANVIAAQMKVSSGHAKSRAKEIIAEMRQVTSLRIGV